MSRAMLYRFNVGPLFKTLFSPWKRDIRFKTWRGFRPLLFLEALINNLITRFIGAIVRSVVIVVGIFATLFIVVLSVFLALFALVAPFVLLGGAFLIGAFWGVFSGVGVFLFAFGIVLLALMGWHNHVVQQTDYTHDLAHAPWRRRALLRLGLNPDEVSDIDLMDETKRSIFLSQHHITPELFVQAWQLEAEQYASKRKRERFWDWQEMRRMERIGKYWSFAYTPHLDRYVTDLSEGDFSSYHDQTAIGKEKAIDMLLLVLKRPTEANALLVGEPGIGKRTIIHALAQRVRENEYTDPKVDYARFLLFDLGQVISDGRTQGIDPKELLRDVMNQAVYAGNVVLIVENLDLYLDPSSDLAVGDVLNEYLSLPPCRIIGLITTQAHHTLGQHQIPALKYFEAITVSEPSKEETIHILLDIFRSEELKRPLFALQALHAIVEGAERYNWELPFPERAIDLAQEVLLYWEKQTGVPVIDKKTVEGFLEEKSGIPMGEVTTEEKEKLLNLETLLHERVIGQSEAIKQIAEAFRKARAGLGNEKKPIGSFLFLGPTGVGKTETAKALAAVYFGDEERMIRLDMSEFQNAQSVPDLIGSAEYGVPGRLSTLVREHPYSLLLLDELEKAYPQALDLFLQVLDEGYLTDGFGHRVNFRNTIIIATSNAGADMLHEATIAGQSMKDLEEKLINTIIQRGAFRPEFLNRFDGVVLFNSLTEEEMGQITSLKLQAFAERLYQEKKVRLTFTPESIQTIVRNGYDREFGARSINRYIADVVEDTVVKRLLEGSAGEGAEIAFSESDFPSVSSQ